MHGPLVIGADAAAVGAASHHEPFVRGRRVPGRGAVGSPWARTLRAVGQSLAALPPSAWMLIDVSTVSAGVLLAYGLVPLPQSQLIPHIALWQGLAIFAFAVTIASLVFGMYERVTLLSRSRILTRMLLTATSATLIVYAITYVIMYATVGRRVTGLAIGTSLICGVGIRLGAWSAIQTVYRGLLVVGSAGLFQSFKAAQANGLLAEYRLLGYTTAEHGTVPGIADRSYLGAITDQIPTLVENGVTDVVVSAEAACKPGAMEWMVACLKRGCRVTNEALFYEKATGQIMVDEITPAWFLSADLKGHCLEQATLKRLVDLVTASVGLLLSAPLWPLIGIAVKLCDGGSVLYSQERVGQNGRVFRLYKFRTMRPNAENGRSVWSSANDPRVTPVGRWLRRTRLDELPQLFNVLMGDMSIVGPRPERPDLVADLTGAVPYYAERHLVKPGITGWAQISFRYGSTMDDAKRKLQFDLYYLKEMSFELDMIILFRTAGTFLRGAC